jgi:hypothetical protein
VDRRIIHGRGFIEILLRGELHFVSLSRIWYRISSDRTRGPQLHLSHPAHAKFVICDCTIENRFHWRRDVTLGEDHCQVRKGSAPRLLAILNSFLLAMLDFVQVSNVPKQQRQFDAQPLQAVRLLLGSLLTFK